MTDTNTNIGTLPRRAMSDEDLLITLRREEQAAVNFQDGTLSQVRNEALNYYDRKPYQNEQEGQSQVVTSEFADTIESMMPSMMRVFAGTESSVEFAPTGPGQEGAAREASAYVPHVLMVQNDGFRILHWFIKDALMYRLGGATVDLEEREIQRPPTEQEAMLFAAVGQEPPSAVMDNKQFVIVDNIAPEDILFSENARDIDSASFVGYRKRVTASDLVELGLAPDDVDDLSSERVASFEESARIEGIEMSPRDRRGDSERPLWVVVAYAKVDLDGDGISEMLRVVYAHAGGQISRLLDRMEWQGPAPISLATPILMSHTVLGRSVFDQVKELQQVKSELTRGMLNNLYFTNYPRPAVSDQVILDSLLDWVPGAPIRFKAGAIPGQGHIEWPQVPSIMDKALAGLEYFDTVRENRTGVVRHNQGLEADTLNKTASGMAMLQNAANQRLELIARTFAETAVKRLYRLIYKAIKRAASGPVQYWSGQRFATVNPAAWPDDMDLTVNVGAGTRDAAMQALTFVATIQEKLVALQGGQAVGPYVTPENIANVAQRMQEAVGYKTPGLFFQPPERVVQAPPPQPQPSPELAKVQAQAQADAMKLQADQQHAQTKLMADVQMKREASAADLEIAREKAALDLQHMREKAALEAQLKREAMMADFSLKREEIALEAELEKYKIDNMPKPGNTELQGQQVASE